MHPYNRVHFAKYIHEYTDRNACSHLTITTIREQQSFANGFNIFYFKPENPISKLFYETANTWRRLCVTQDVSRGYGPGFSFTEAWCKGIQL